MCNLSESNTVEFKNVTLMGMEGYNVDFTYAFNGLGLTWKESASLTSEGH
jgi:hypothetical protein